MKGEFSVAITFQLLASNFRVDLNFFSLTKFAEISARSRAKFLNNQHNATCAMIGSFKCQRLL